MAMQINKRNSLSLCSPYEMKPSLDIVNPSQDGMNLNIELQAKMIEELLVKNA